MENFDYVPPKATTSMADMLKGYAVEVPATKTRGGINGQITEQRAKIAKLLELPMGRVGRMTSGWTGDQLYRLNNAVDDYVARQKSLKKSVNPPAVWWVFYKKEKERLCNSKTEKGN